jgi:putative oxidoreductase
LNDRCGQIYSYGQTTEEIAGLLRRIIHARFCSFAAHRGATHVEHPAHCGGVLYMEHGLAKILDFPHQPNHVPYALFNLNPGLQGLLELVGGLLLALGLFTRCVAFVLAGNMAATYFVAHAPRGFFPLLNAGELAIVYCFVFLYVWAAGGGEWSLDRLRAPKSARRGERTSTSAATGPY